MGQRVNESVEKKKGENKAATKIEFTTAPNISLPKGGGAIRGIEEKFSVNPVTGTSSLTVPIYTSHGRSGFGPELSLAYNSGAGNSPFGIGWDLPLPAISRKTEKGLPRYQDSIESDVFILSGSEDLVPCMREDGVTPKSESSADGKYLIYFYRPRIEGLFTRIEKWVDKKKSDTYWRSISKDNITTFYGRTIKSRIYDPSDNSRVFQWMIEESRDDKGNIITYTYKKENQDNIDKLLASEINRLTGDSSFSNQYIKSIKYGNKTPFQYDFLLEAIFDYGEHRCVKSSDRATYSMKEIDKWDCRSDAFSSYKAGFEVRTYRLCKRVLMIHHFPEEPIGENCMVRSTDFHYSFNNISNYSYLTSVTQTGYKWDNNLKAYCYKSIPPIEFTYTKGNIGSTPESLDSKSLENLPVGIDGSTYQWIDFENEGIYGILSEQSDTFYYKHNLGDGKFAPVKLVGVMPSGGLQEGKRQFMDLAGEGRNCIVQFGGPNAGYYEPTEDNGWEPFRSFSYLPNIDWSDPELKHIDLNGDGFADLLISKDDIFVCYYSLAKEGYGEAELVRGSYDEEKGPALVFQDMEQSVYLSDMSGDGLSDIVRIRNGEVCYWPNLGYGRFGAKITMDHSPYFDYSDQFNQKRIRLVDIDGTGTTDIIYLGREAISCWYNQSGNGWSRKPVIINALPAVDNLASIMVIDLLGKGTACLVWSSSLPKDTEAPLKYIDLMGEKPHLLQSIDNNMGKVTSFKYVQSTKFYLEDKIAGKPWITKLPFPVHVVERIETYDRISHNYFVTRYQYHHGYYDRIEREFRGFGMVEQFDTEEIGALQDSLLSAVCNMEEASYVPPVHTKTWFHTGAYLEGTKISNHFVSEYYMEPGISSEQQEELQKSLLLMDTILPEGLSLQEEREACRALKGSILRQEVYAQDDTAKSMHPYTVSERNYSVKCIQRRRNNSNAVFFAHPLETLDYHYEREIKLLDSNNPGSGKADPRVTHQIILMVDNYGNTERTADIAYQRRGFSERLPEQGETHITFHVSRFTNYPEAVDWYRVGLPVETRSYELINPPQPDTSSFLIKPFTFEQIKLLTEQLLPLTKIEPELHNTIGYEKWNWRQDQSTPNGSRLRLIEHIRTLYYDNDLNGPLSLENANSLALTYSSYKLAFNPELLTVFDSDQALLRNIMEQEGGYISSDDYKNKGWFPAYDEDDYWWIPIGQQYFSPLPEPLPLTFEQDCQYAKNHFYLPQAVKDPFGSITRVEYDVYDLLQVKATDPVGNIVSAVADIDYRVLLPWRITDPNGNRSEVAYDLLGMVAGTAVMGKVKENVGDSLQNFRTDLSQEEIDAFFTDPKSDLTATILGGATTRIIYDIDRYYRDKDNGKPVYAATLSRETHLKDPLKGKDLKIQVSFSYSDGFGREIQKKHQAEAGTVEEKGTSSTNRWVGSGWAIYNNKGKPIRQYEPYFSSTHDFEFAKQRGVSPVLFYDPMDRVVTTLHPNHTYEKVVFDPWQQTTWDVNDTISPILGDNPFNPKNDPDVGDFFKRLSEEAYLPTWYNLRTDNGKALLEWPDLDVLGNPISENKVRRDREKASAVKAAEHANTPTVMHFDALGRSFLTVTDNGKDADGIEQKYETRTEYDIEGNERFIKDALGRIVIQYDYDMLGYKTKQISMDSGTRRILNDVTQKPLRTWDERGFTQRYEYDLERRQISLFLSGDNLTNVLVERTVYGDDKKEGPANPENTNHRGRVYKSYDGAGVVTNSGLHSLTGKEEGYDFKGNLLASTRQLLKNCKEQVDWNTKPLLEVELFISNISYDGLNRPYHMITYDGSETRNTYNEANLLDKVDVRIRGASDWTSFIKNIEYDAKCQRTYVEYGNHVHTQYEYDPLTFRMTRLYTWRGKNNTSECLPQMTPRTCQDSPESCIGMISSRCVLQNLYYFYDPVGNITHIQDNAQQTIYYRNQRIEPSADYEYDAIYRLIKASGREHLGQTNHQLNSPHQTDFNDAFRVQLLHPGDGSAMGNYTEKYQYDEAGNILKMVHQASSGSWSRLYTYEGELDPLPFRRNNRLIRVNPPGPNEDQHTDFNYDAHGNMIHMPHLNHMQWDYKDQLYATTKQVINNGDSPETTYYIYDASGQRIRKYTERQNGVRKDERIYIGGYEIYREYDGNGVLKAERETLQVMDDKQRIALIETKTIDKEVPFFVPDTVLRYQYSNHLGSSGLELDEEGRIISYEEYYPYGSTSYQAVRSGMEANLKRYRYLGKERDTENGFYYLGARYYASWLGRWTSADPIGISGGINLFVYSGNSPIVYHDPSGTTEEKTTVSTNTKNILNTLSFGASLADITSSSMNFEAIGQGLRRAKMALNIDEIQAIANGGSWSDPKNKQFLDWITNQFVKNAGVASHQIPSRPQMSLADALAKGPDAFRKAASELMTRNFSEVKELESITNESVAAMKNLKRTPRKLANAVNKAIRGRIAREATQDAKLVARALREAGFDPKTMTAIKQNTAAVQTANASSKGSGLLSKTVLLGKGKAALGAAGKVLGKVATPIAVVSTAVQFATAKTSEDYANAGVSAVSTALTAAPHPLAKAAGVGLAAGQMLDQTLNVSDYSSRAGVAVYEKLKSAGLNDTASFVTGGVASVAAIPLAIPYAAVKKVSSWFK